MKKNTKKIVISLLGTSLATAIVGLLVTSKQTDDKIKELVTEVWNENKTMIIKELSLQKEPTLCFKKLEDAVMSTSHKCYMQGFHKTIIRAESSYVIDVDIEAVKQAVNYYIGMISFRPFSGINKMVVKQLLCHECRHIYQVENGFYVGRSMLFADCYNDINGYGNRPQELDANEWALTMASSDKEYSVFKVQKLQQENIGSLFADRKEIQDESRALFKMFWSL